MRNNAVRYVSVCLAVSSFILIGCGGGEMKAGNKVDVMLNDVHEDAWRRLAERKIYFGHQSVGRNIVDGMIGIRNRIPRIALRIENLEESKGVRGGKGLIHGNLGSNGQPSGKIREFVRVAGDGEGPPYDIAVMKLCYADFTSETDIQGLFREYKAAMAELKKRRPGLLLLHMTVPLTSSRPGVKSFIKGLLGRKDIGYLENMKRNNYNDLVRAEFGGREPVFDIAEIESVSANGNREFFREGGKMYPILSPDYSDDGGHLNGIGKEIVAGEFLSVLARLNR